MKRIGLLILLVAGLLLASACQGEVGSQGARGPAGAQGSVGAQGPEGAQGEPGPGFTEEQVASLEKAGALAAAIPFPSLEAVPRGCPACHVLVDPETGKYTLAYEAHERAELRGEEHPEEAPDGTSLAVIEEVNVTTCLQCHGAGTGDREGMGTIAPLMLRDIVHPAHMSSQTFKLHYGGSCFTCHNVNGDGEWEILTEAVDVNEKGVPNPDTLPIPGAVEIHGGEH